MSQQLMFAFSNLAEAQQFFRSIQDAKYLLERSGAIPQASINCIIIQEKILVDLDQISPDMIFRFGKETEYFLRQRQRGINPRKK